MDLLIMVDSVYPHISLICSSNIDIPQDKNTTRHWKNYGPKIGTPVQS